MTAETEEANQLTPVWRWPGRWIKDETFWRDIASRTFSGVIVAFCVYWGAVIMGYIKTPENMHTAFQVTLGGITTLLSSWWTGKFPFKRLRKWLMSRVDRLPLPLAHVAAWLSAFAAQVAIFLFIACAMTLGVWGAFRIAAALLGVTPLF